MATVIYAPEADDDLEAIVEFIARDKPNAARMWLIRIREHVRRLRYNPALEKPVTDSVCQDANRLESAAMFFSSGLSRVESKLLE